jgi:hypothetical protein
MADVDNSADILDSRDIIARIRELEDARDTALDSAKELQERITELSNKSELTITEADELATLQSSLWQDEDGETLYQVSSDWDEETACELQILLSVQEQAEGYTDWSHGCALIRDSYFEDYARSVADDIHGRGMRDQEWPFTHIDWEGAAEALQSDYTSIYYDGVTYWIQ